MRRRVFALGAAAIMLAACANPGPGQPPAQAPVSASQANVATNRATVAGSVKVPNNLVAAGGMNLVAAGSMNLVAAGSGNLVAAGGMNLVAAGGMKLVAAGSGNLVAAGSMNLVAAGGMNYALQAATEQSLGGVVVFLCDGLGRPIAGLPPVSTDDQGRYAIPEVPMGFTLVVNALVPYQDGRRALMTALVRSGRPDEVEVDAASTLTAIRAASIRKDGQLGEFEAALFRSAVGDVRAHLTDANLPDYRDVDAVGRRAAEVEGQVAGLGGKLEALRSTLAQGPASAQLAVGVVQPTPAPTATPERPLDGACSEAKPHVFRVQDLKRNGVKIVIRTRTQGVSDREAWPVLATSDLSGGVSTSITIPEGCAHRVELLDAFGRTIISDDALIVKPGSGSEVALPF